MVAQASSAGGDRAPKGAPIYRPGQLVRVLTALDPVLSRGVILYVVHEEHPHGWAIYYVVATVGAVTKIPAAGVSPIVEDSPAPAHRPMCECHDDAPEPAAAPAATPEPTEPEGTIAWYRVVDEEFAWGSHDFRFKIYKAGGDYAAEDRWSERSHIAPSLKDVSDWCESRKEGQRLAWKESGSGQSASLAGAQFRVNCEGTYQFQGVDCRFPVSHRLRRSRFFDLLEDAQRWCEVRAACRVEGEGATATLHYVGPIPF